MATLALTNAEVLRAIGMVTGYNRAPGQWEPAMLDDARAIVRSGLRKFFHPLPFHQWHFLERRFPMSGVATYNTGTVTIVDGTVTLAGGTWPTWAADGVLRVNGQSCFVASRTSDSVIVLQVDSIDADALTTFTLHRWRYALPADFGELIDGCVYHFGQKSKMLQGADEGEIRLRYATNFQVGNPIRFAKFSETNSSGDTVHYIGVWPVFDDTAFAQTTYRSEPADKLNVSDMTADGTVIQIEAAHAETLLAAIMSAAEEYYNRTTEGPHSIRFAQRLAASIEHDKASEGPALIDVPNGVDRQLRAMFDPAYPSRYYDTNGNLIT